ncbi:MAG: toll/interleukin-1 receptor domain-containing protein [Anaerolineales bacterium]|nr:toll/interleukin-1 receptor domain-containing protein [Anaerolineales bacterium]
MAKIFVSYSRKDIEFARKLTDELQKNDLDFWVDWEGIPPTVDWWQQIEKGIEEADVFLFLISPDSASSKICAQEIDCAVKNGKRLIPLVVRDIKGEEAPAQLGHINWIFFRKTDDFDASTAKLLTAIQTDYEWAQTHRRLQVKALEWERNNHENSFLLRGKDLQYAELQLATNTSKEPQPTDLQREHVLKSRQAADRQRRITAGISATGIIALAVLAVYAFIQAGAARVAQAEAEKQAQAAIVAQERAEQEQAKAETAQLHAEAETRIATAGRLALESENSLAQYPQRALLLALEAVKVNEDANEPVRPDAEEALREALEKVTGTGVTGFKHEVSLVQFTNDNRWLVAGTNALEGEVKIWNLEKTLNETDYQPFYISFPIELSQNLDEHYWSSSINLSPQTSWLIVADTKETRLWQIDDEDEQREPLVFEGKIEFANIKSDYFVIEDQTNQVIYWQIDPKTLTKKQLASFNGSLVKLSDDRKYLVTDDPAQGLLLWNFATLSSQPVLLSEKHISDFFYTTISPTNEWLVLFENQPREEYPIAKYNPDPPYEQIGTEPWNSTTIVLIPLQQTKKQEFKIELDFAVDTLYVKPLFSKDGDSFAYSGSNPPDQFGGATGGNIGVLKFTGLQFLNLTYSAKLEYYSQISFIKNDWLYLEIYDAATGVPAGRFIDLREDELITNGETSVLLFIDSQRNVTFTEDENYLLTQSNGDLINFHQLDFNHFISIEPASQDSEIQTFNKLAIDVQNDYKNLGMENYATKTAQSQDGAWFAAGGFDGSMRFWNNLNPHEDASLPLSSIDTNYIAFSNDNQWMAINDTIWQLENGKPKTAYPFAIELNAYGGNVPFAVFSSDSRWFIYLQYSDIQDNEGINYNIILIDLTKMAEEGKINSVEISKREGSYDTIKFSQNSEWVFVNGYSNSYDSNQTDHPPSLSFLYNLENREYYEVPIQTSIFAFTDDQKYIAFAINETQDYSTIWKGVEVWSLPNGTSQSLKKVGELNTDGYPVLSSNGRWLSTHPLAPDKNEAQLWDLNCVITNSACKPFIFLASSAGFSPNSHYLVSYHIKTQNPDDAQIIGYDVWSIKNNTPEKIDERESELISTLGISNTGNWILLTKPTEATYIYPTIRTAGLFSTWGGYDYIGPTVTTFDGYGHHTYGGGGGGGLAIGGYQADYSVEAFYTGDDSSLSLRGHESNVSMSQISPNEKFVLTNSGNPKDDNGLPEKLLRLWNMDNMRLDPVEKPIVLPLHLDPTSGEIQALAFSPNSEWVYVVNDKNILHFYPTSIAKLKERACIAIGRNLTISEWERFFPNTEYRKTCENLPEHPSAVSQ